MKVHLLNSAVMPQAGTYSLEKYEAETWKAELKAAINDDVDFQQYIGYLSTLTFVEHLIGKSLGEAGYKCLYLRSVSPSRETEKKPSRSFSTTKPAFVSFHKRETRRLCSFTVFPPKGYMTLATVK